MGRDANPQGKVKLKPFLYKFGLGLLFLAVVCWILVAIAAVLPFSLGMKAGIITGCLIIGEVLFWIGAVFVGKEVVTRYKRHLNPRNWFKREKRRSNEK